METCVLYLGSDWFDWGDIDMKIAHLDQSWFVVVIHVCCTSVLYPLDSVAQQHTHNRVLQYDPTISGWTDKNWNLTGLRKVRRVDPSGDTASCNRPHVGDEPLGGVEAQDVDAPAGRKSNRHEALSEPVVFVGFDLLQVGGTNHINQIESKSTKTFNQMQHGITQFRFLYSTMTYDTMGKITRYRNKGVVI